MALGEEEIKEHEQKINKYQAILAARLKAKYFSNKTFDGEKNIHEKSDSTSLTADSSAKNNSPRTDSSPKNSASTLATDNNLTPGKRQPSKKT
uniref:Uncharacterized protein n=1 Tax=Leersia perrieri TaxID=77586 RepID=A0A0D9XES1_9ORYZ